MTAEVIPSFWVIRVTDPLRRKGFVEIRDGKPVIVLGKYHGEVKRFDSKGEATAFVVQTKMIRRGTISILSNIDLMSNEHGTKVASGELYGIVNDVGNWLHYDNGAGKYFFDATGKYEGGCAWYDLATCQTAITNTYQSLFPYFTLTPKPL